MRLSKKKISYWSPHINPVATVMAVYNSAKSLKKYSNSKFEIEILNAFGEWNKFRNNKNKIKIRKLFSIGLLKKIPSQGFFFSRLKYLIIFFFSFIPLTKYLKKEKPDYLIIHLITSLPLIINYLFKLDTKIILRISGKPQLNILRFFFWKIMLKKIEKISFPTKETYKYFKSLNIVEKKKLYLLYDPVLDSSQIKIQNKDTKKIFSKYKDYFLCIGRLTKQKNFSFIIECFSELINKNKNLKLLIIGEGENYKKLHNLIMEYNLQKNIFLIGYKKNVFNYLKKAKAFILCSLWEDPGFVLVEAIYANTFVISSDCPSGPKEIVGNKKGILFKNNSKKDFMKKFNYFETLDKFKLKKIKIKAKKNIKNYSLNHHSNNLTKLLIS